MFESHREAEVTPAAAKAVQKLLADNEFEERTRERGWGGKVDGMLEEAFLFSRRPAMLYRLRQLAGFAMLGFGTMIAFRAREVALVEVVDRAAQPKNALQVRMLNVTRWARILF